MNEFFPRKSERIHYGAVAVVIAVALIIGAALLFDAYVTLLKVRVMQQYLRESRIPLATP